MSPDRRDSPLVIFGASGFVGRHVMDAMARTWLGPATVVTRQPTSTFNADVRVVRGGLTDPVVASNVPEHATVVNLAYAGSGTADENLRLAGALADVCLSRRARRLVHVSTAMVCGPGTGPWVTEETPSHPHTPYQRTKLAVEECLTPLRGSGVPLVVLRPTAVFGRGGLNLVKLVSDLSRSSWQNYARACLFGRRPMNLIPVETVAAAIAFAAESDRAITDGLYLVADDEASSNTFAEVERVFRRELGVGRHPLPPFPLPSSLLGLALRASGRLSTDPDARFSSARLAAAGFRRPVTFEHALERYAASFQGGQPHVHEGRA